MSIYPKNYSIDDFFKTCEMWEGNVVKIAAADGNYVGIFKTLKKGFMEPFWNLSIDPKWVIKKKNVSQVKDHSSDFTIISQFKNITVLAADYASWDQKTGLTEETSPARRRSSIAELPAPPHPPTRNSSGSSSVGPVSPITVDEIRMWNWSTAPSPRTKIELQPMGQKPS